MKTCFSKDLFLIINYWNIEESWKWVILWSKMPSLGDVFVLDKNFFSKSCKQFFTAHFLQNKFSNKLPLGLCRLVVSRL
jgi:hypothetical protein